MKNKIIFLLVFLPFIVMLSSCMSSGPQNQSSEEEKALVANVLVKNRAGVEAMLNNGVSPDAKGISGLTALSTAISGSNLDIAELLLTHGAGINVTDNDGNTALFYAQKPKIQQWLIEKGIDIQVVSKKERTAFDAWCISFANILSEAKKKESMDILKSQNIPVTREQMEEVFWVSENDIVETIKLYIKAGYNIDSTHDSLDDTALILSARLDNYLLMDELLKAGADPHIDNNMGDDALNIITSNPESKHSSGEYKAIVTALLKYGADINGTDSEGNTPLCNAALIDSLSRVKILLAMKGSDVDAPGQYGETALFKSNTPGIVKALYTAYADIEFKNNGGSTPLFILTDADSVQYLISKGANIHHINDQGQNILVHNMFKANKQYIASYDYDGVLNAFIGKFKVLLAAGIDVNFKTDKEGDTALQLAGKVPFKELVAMFQKAGAI